MRKIKVEDRGKEVLIEADNGVLIFLGKQNIRIISKKISKRTVSWYYHDIFKKLSYVYFTKEEGRNVFYLESEKLISKTKIKKLVKKQDFKNKKYAFFNYDLVLELSK